MTASEDSIPVSVLRRWAKKRQEVAEKEYGDDGRSGYGDIAGQLEVCQDLDDLCNEWAGFVVSGETPWPLEDNDMEEL